MKRNDSDMLVSRIFCDSSLPADTVSHLTPAQRLESHLADCDRCAAAMTQADEGIVAFHGLCRVGKLLAVGLVPPADRPLIEWADAALGRAEMAVGVAQ